MRKRSAIVPTEGEATPMTTVMHPISILPSVCNSDEVIPCESESPRGDLLQNHIDSQRRVLIALGCTDPVLNVVPHCGSEEHSSRTAGVSGQLQGDLASGLSNQYLNSSRLRNTHQMDSKSLISKVTSKLYIAHVEEMLPPKGTRTREEAAAWSEKMKKIHAYHSGRFAILRSYVDVIMTGDGPEHSCHWIYA
ncbi:hypothetical protein ERJ75_001442400 [Trypanosoma vivax]|nr:hypothetical protein ERJ75_001442400 [Trypanosoma vivax]